MPPIDNDVIDLCDSSDESRSGSSSSSNSACKPRGGRKSSDESSSSIWQRDCDDDSASIRNAPRKLPPELHMTPHSKASATSHQDNVRNASNNETRRVSDQAATGRQESRESLPSSSGEATRRRGRKATDSGSIENEISGNNTSSSNNDQRKPKAKSIPKKEEAKSNCIGVGKLLSVAPVKPKNDDNSIISISSTDEEISISNKKSIAVKSAKQQPSTLERGASAKLPYKSIRRRRSSNGYQLKEGEQIVWALEKESSKRPHQAIIIYPQPAPTSTEIEDMIFVEWLHSPNTFVWLPIANIQYENENNSDGTTAGKRKRKEPKRLADSMGAMFKLACEKDGRGAFISKKKGTKRRAIMKEEESNQACAAVIASKKKRTKSCRVTLCKDFTYARKQPKVKLSARAAQARLVRAGTLSAANTKVNEDSDFHGEWWHKDQPKKPTAKTQQSSGELSVPVTVVTRDDESSVSSSVSLELPDTSSCSDRSSEHEHGQEGHQRNVSFAARDTGCHVCASQKHHHCLIEKLLGDLGTFESNPEEVVDWFDIVTDFICRFKVILQGLNDDSCDGTSIFYHRCSKDNEEAPDPTFTVVKLIQLFDIICQKVSTAFDNFNCKAPKNDLMQLLFRPWEKSVPKVGVILQMMHLVTREIVNSREEEFNAPTSPDELDQLVGVTFGLQLLQTMARNAYFGCKAKLEARSIPSCQFLDQPLESHRTCMKNNCQNQQQRLTGCKVCGIKFHKNCFVCRDIGGKVDTCPTCKSSLQLLGAARTGNLSDIYLLVVERGASPLLTMLSESSRSETALHAAIRANNYDLTSMLLFASHILLNCDGSLSNWKIPDYAFGLCGRQTPFQSGIDTIINIMNERPPVEVLLLLCGRGAKHSPVDIQKALKKRHRMMMVKTEMDSDNALVKSDISFGLEPQPMPVASTSDFEPSYDIYIGRSFESRCTAIRWFDCRCDFGKQLVSLEGECTATNLSILHQRQAVPPSWKSYCNYLCPSRSKGKEMCDCQLAEAGVHCKLEVFNTPDGRGLGVRTAKGVSIKKDQIICHYSGEIITAKESQKRDVEYAKAGHKGSYLLDMDKKREYTIDATKFRSIAALINHSCSGSNCKLFRAMANHLDINFPYLGLCAKEDIGELTELTFNYGQKPEHCLCQACCVLAHKK